MTNANDRLREFTGTENWYRHFLGGLYTDGVKHMAETFQAYWFIDLVFSHQTAPKVKAQPFQKWVLTRNCHNRFTASCTDGNGNELALQEITFSDFSDDQLTLFFCDGVLLLPSEY